MQRNRLNVVTYALVVLLLASAGLWARTGQAASTVPPPECGDVPQGQACVVVQFADGSYVARCVPFEGESLSGLELLTRSGLHTIRSGSVVCRIEKDGCNYPDQPCFCQCTGSASGGTSPHSGGGTSPHSGGCSFWSYWQLREGSWAFSSSGCADHRVRSGEVDGWHWPSGALTVQTSFAEIADPRRIAPGVPQLTVTGSALQVYVPYQGDNDGDSAVSARLHVVGTDWPEQSVALTRVENAYSTQWNDLSAGKYQVRLDITDSTGINASATWVLTETVGMGSSGEVYLPIVTRGNAVEVTP